MEPLLCIARFGFYAATVITLVSAVMVVTLRNLFHCAMALVLTLLGVASTYIYLRAEFVAVIQILVYVGAIMTLVIFAIMLTSRIGDVSVPQNNKQYGFAFLALAAFNFFFITAVNNAPWRWNGAAFVANVDARSLGVLLMNEYVFPFEIISVVLIVALVGAIIVGRSDQ